MSHSLRDGKTRGLLDGITDWAFTDISQRILKPGSHYYQHPLHIPAMLLNIFFDHAAWEVNRLAKDVVEFEDLSRGAKTSSLDKYDAITTQLQYVSRNLDFQQNLAKFLLETMVFLDTKVFTRQAGQNPSDYITYVNETNPHMEEKLNNMLHLIENNLNTCQYLQARTKDALDYVRLRIRAMSQQLTRITDQWGHQSSRQRVQPRRCRQQHDDELPANDVPARHLCCRNPEHRRV